MCLRVKGCVVASVGRFKAPLIGWSCRVTPSATNVQMVHCRGGILYGAGRNYGIAVTWDWVYKTHLRVTTAGCGCGPLALCTARLVLALSSLLFLSFCYINYFCAMGAEGCDSTSNSKGSYRCSEQLDGHSAPTQRVGFFTPRRRWHSSNNSKQPRAVCRARYLTCKYQYQNVPVDEFHITSDGGDSRCVIFLFQVNFFFYFTPNNIGIIGHFTL